LKRRNGVRKAEVGEGKTETSDLFSFRWVRRRKVERGAQKEKRDENPDLASVARSVAEATMKGKEKSGRQSAESDTVN